MYLLQDKDRPLLADDILEYSLFFQAGNGGNRKSCGSSKVSATGNSSSQSAQQQSTPASTQAPTPSSGSGGGGGAPSNGGHHHHHHAHRPNKTPGHNLLDPIQVLCTNLIPLMYAFIYAGKLVGINKFAFMLHICNLISGGPATERDASGCCCRL